MTPGASTNPARERAKANMMRELERQCALAEAHGERRLARALTYAAHQILDNNNPDYFKYISRLKRIPVTIEEFVDSPEFMGNLEIELWPNLRRDVFAINPDIFAGDQGVHEVLMGGATAIGKSFMANVTQAYQLYHFSCIDKPQLLYNLSINTPIVFMFYSVSEKVTRRVLYEPFRSLFVNMPYTQKWMRYDKYKESELVFEGGLQVVPTLANVQAMVGQAIASATEDEVNFMNVIENSMTVVGNRGMGGKYDQAEVVHSTVTRRRKGRFTSRGPVPGCIIASSSTRYNQDFLDRRIEQVKTNREDDTNDKSKVVWFRRKQYEVQPSDRFEGPKFRVLVGNDHWATRILEEGELEGVHYPEGAQVEEVPIEYFYDFVNDPENALRDVIGVATDVITPFFTQRHKVIEAVVAGRTAGLKSWVDKQNVDLAVDGMPQINEENLPTDLDTPRFVHIDLATTGVGSNDRAGIAISKVAEYKDVAGPRGLSERLPVIAVEVAISLKPSKQHPVDITAVRQWIMMLKQFYGFNIYMVTYDGFASKESIQQFRKAGIRSGEISMDKTTEPYTTMRSAYYQDRVLMVDNEEARLEIVNLEMNEKKKQVTHPPRVGKDIADAICGSIFAATNSRKVRTQVGVSTDKEVRVLDEETGEVTTAHVKVEKKKTSRKRVRDRQAA
jgi:hypothetical protein